MKKVWLSCEFNILICNIVSLINENVSTNPYVCSLFQGPVEKYV